MELCLESLQTRRNKHKLTTFYEIMHDLAPPYLLDLIPPIVGQTNNYALRNADHIQGFRSNSNLFSDSYFPYSIKATLSYILLTLIGKDDMSRPPFLVLTFWDIFKLVLGQDNVSRK